MIILDTHIWVWWVDDNERLTKKHREYIEEYQSEGLGVSIVSCFSNTLSDIVDRIHAVSLVRFTNK
jgi:PIN domain nuclease of toxin-antitoxin system